MPPAFARMRASFAALAFAAAAVCGGCAKSAPSHPPASAAQVAHGERADLDAALKSIPHADVVDSYHADDEHLVVAVDAAAWRGLGETGQEALKMAIFAAWAASYAGRGGRPGAHPFLSVEDLQGNDLGSYFQS